METNSTRLVGAIAKWISDIQDYPGWRKWQGKRFGKTLYHGDEFEQHDSSLEDFVFSPDIQAQHTILTGYLALSDTLSSLRDCEYYFRRYPFREFPMGKHRHLTNICEMYFSRIYELRERMKRLLNALNKHAPKNPCDVGKLIKSFDKTFDSEIRERNKIHHHSRFETIEIDQVWLTEFIATDVHRDKGWDVEHRIAYRKATKWWVNQVRERSNRAELYVEAVAGRIILQCDFLQPYLTDKIENEK